MGSGTEDQSLKKEGGPKGYRRLSNRTEEGCCILQSCDCSDSSFWSKLRELRINGDKMEETNTD